MHIKFYKKKLFKTIASLALALTLIIPQTSSVVRAEENQLFIPFRCDIPKYLSLNSSQKSSLVKGLWQKIFYEEANWNATKEGSTNWVTKYNDYYSSNDGTMKLLSKGVQNNKITYSTGDFEAFFGNTIKNNPEFLGELIGISGSTSSNLTKQIVCTYLTNPTKYNIFAQKIVALTSNGTYIGTGRGANNNTLKNVSYNGATFDIYVLTTLASLYEGDGSETYLSNKQVTWLKSYQQYLYNQYVTEGSKSLASKYTAIYDLIARSTFAANNQNGKGQEFFNYVVKTKKGVGAWLNLNDNINIAGLNSYDDLVSVFAVADGWCCGREPSTKCGNRSKCIANGSVTERIAYQLYKNTTAITYIMECRDFDNVLNSKNGQYGYFSRFNAKHLGKGLTGSFYKRVVSGHGYYGESSASRDYHTDGNGTVSAYKKGTVEYPLGDIALINSTKYVYVFDVVEPNTIGWYTNRLASWSVTVNGKSIATDKNQSRVQAVFTSKGLQFNISGLSSTERASAIIYLTAESFENYDLNYPAGSPSSYTATVEVQFDNSVYIEGSFPNCIANGHKYTASEKNGTLVWSSDYSKVTFKPYCANEASHKVDPITVSTTVTTEGNYLVYTASCPQLKLSDTKRVSKTNGSTSETIPLTKSNTSGDLSKSVPGTTRIWPAGAASPATYIQSYADVNVSVLPGVIKTGTKSITVNMDYKDELLDLSMKVLSSTGEELGRNATSVCVGYDSNGNHHYSHSFIVYLNSGVTDKDLLNCRMVISARATDIHWTSKGHPYESLPNALASINVKSITAKY